MALDEVADELYALPPADFVAVRNARAKEARSAGDRDLAAAITALAKPTKVAWLANQLVRRRRADVQPLLELGAGLREATAALSGEDLRRLTKQQHQLVHALVQEAKSLAGGPVTEDVADGVDKTLRAALADSALADQLLQGRLTEGLEFSGFGGGGAGPVRPKLAVVQQPARRTGVEAKAAARREAIDGAEQALAETRMRAAATEQEREAAQSAVDEAAAASRELAARLDELRAELDRVKVQKDAAEQAERSAHKALEVAERAARGAARKAASAEADLSALRQSD
ncbi:MAG: hypothetical protein QOI76_26 [Frankiales bacterium]|nr:hypothetical protein [Frankiales bacterium]